MLATPVQVATAALRAAHESLAVCELDMLTGRELLALLDELETVSCQLPARWHRALARLQAETTPKELGAKNWKDGLRIRWRMSATDANRRLGEAAELGPRRTLTGEPLAPVLAATAAAHAAGDITSEHVDKIRDAMDRIHPTSTRPVPRPTHRLPRPADHAHRPRWRLHQTVLHGPGLRRPGASRTTRLG